MALRTEVRDGTGHLLAYKAGTDPASGLTAYSEPEDYVQVLVWRYSAGKTLATHEHLTVPRVAQRTQEVIVVTRGAVRARIFDRKRNPVAAVDVAAGESLVLLDGGHGYEITQDDTQVVEVKNGPYPGAEEDRVRFGP